VCGNALARSGFRKGGRNAIDHLVLCACSLVLAGAYFIVNPLQAPKLAIMGFFLAGLGGAWLWSDWKG
jgi:hypothetical protein